MLDVTLNNNPPSDRSIAGHRRPATEHSAGPAPLSAGSIHAALLRESGGDPGSVDDLAWLQSRSFLTERLAAAARLPGGGPDDLPDDPRQLAGWMTRGHRRVADAYRTYLAERAAGQPRRYFGNLSHALYFLRAAAPTKLVDGAWLYGLLPRWNDPRFTGLLRTYLEELGDGQADRNHVVLYRRLLESQGCEPWDRPDDAVFMQGAIQLSLAHHGADFLPEAIGFNLGYEQLPLHLLITAYELAELGIDPYYFTLHVTVDNASSGHARKAVQSVLDAMPRLGDADAFYRRVRNGWRLNDLGLGTTDLIESFDIDRELAAMLARKAAVGAGLHSDLCRIGGRTVNEWLADPDGMPGFLKALVASGWIKRGRDTRDSRFWQLLHGDAPPMFGVFDRCEQQLLHDWIADGWTLPAADGGGADASAGGAPTVAAGSEAPRPIRRFRRRLTKQDGDRGAAERRLEPPPGPAAPAASLRQWVDAQLDSGSGADRLAGFDALADGGGAEDAELQPLRERLHGASSRAELMSRLIPLLSPAHHPTPAGLAATRLFGGLLASC